MTFDELWRRNCSCKDRVISFIDIQAETSFLCDPACGESAFEDLDEEEMNRFLECFEKMLMIGDPDQRGAWGQYFLRNRICTAKVSY